MRLAGTAIWDHTVFHVVLTGGPARDGSSLEAQLSDRPADRPNTQTRPGSTEWFCSAKS